MSRRAWVLCVIVGATLGFGAGWATLAPEFAVQEVRQQIEAAADAAARDSGDDPRLQIERFVRELEAIDASGTPEAFETLFDAYRERFRAGLQDFHETGRMGRFDAEIADLARQIQDW